MHINTEGRSDEQMEADLAEYEAHMAGGSHHIEQQLKEGLFTKVRFCTQQDPVPSEENTKQKTLMHAMSVAEPALFRNPRVFLLCRGLPVAVCLHTGRCKRVPNDIEHSRDVGGLWGHFKRRRLV